MDCLPDLACIGKPPNCKLKQLCLKNCKKDNKFKDENGQVIKEKFEKYKKCLKDCDGKKKRKLKDIFDFIKNDPRYASTN
jgi:hypothetical protein